MGRHPPPAPPPTVVLSGSGSDSCPFPALTEFVIRLASRGGVAAGVRAWSAAAKPSTLTSSPVCVCPAPPCAPARCAAHAVTHITFHMCKNRFCFNVGRQHKSNNVNWLADLVLGVCVQSCTDEACKGFWSQPIPIPAVVVRALLATPCSRS